MRGDKEKKKNRHYVYIERSNKKVFEADPLVTINYEVESEEKEAKMDNIKIEGGDQNDDDVDDGMLDPNAFASDSEVEVEQKEEKVEIESFEQKKDFKGSYADYKEENLLDSKDFKDLVASTI